MLAGVLIRQFFVLRHKGSAKAWLPVTACVLLAGVAVAIAPAWRQAGRRQRRVRAGARRDRAALRALPCGAADTGRLCAAAEGRLLETPEQIAAQAAKIGETVGNKYMPIGNLTQMTDDERALVAAWVAQGAKTR